MFKIDNYKIDVSESESNLKNSVADFLRIDVSEISKFVILKRSVDARKKPKLFFVYSLAVSLAKNETKFYGEYEKIELNESDYNLECGNVISASRPIIVGCGPAGMFCALQLAKCGLKPIILERGKPVSERIADIKNLMENSKLNPESNILFGEGGAGTFSDGKLNTGINSSVTKKVLRVFTDCGAPAEIEYLAKPHIGSDNLRDVVSNLNKQITKFGGEIRFENKVESLIIENGKVKGVLTSCNGNIQKLKSDIVILAIGHSARDTFRMIHSENVKMIPKPFSMGVRVEHKKELINKSQYGSENVKFLKSADYKISTHLENGRGVYSFCMCPGGQVVPAMHQKGTINVNGMSYYARNDKNSNSAILVGITPDDFYISSPLDGIDFQEKYERKAYNLVNKLGTFYAPCQTLKDFKQNKKSSEKDISWSSYKPMVKPALLSECLPGYVCESIKLAFDDFGKKIKDFNSDSTLLVGIETRSSCPVRIERNENNESVSLQNLYPIGEGAGYSGGIVSSAVDGINTALKIIKKLKQN